MAADWIKVETTTPEKPEVITMAERLKLSEDTVVGKLVRLWSWADQNSVTGTNVRATEKFIDKKVDKRGFSAALREVGWLAGTDGALTFPGFERHNGRPAKERAQEQHRKREEREAEKRRQKQGQTPDSPPDTVRIPPGQNPDACPVSDQPETGLEIEVENRDIPPPPRVGATPPPLDLAKLDDHIDRIANAYGMRDNFEDVRAAIRRSIVVHAHEPLAILRNVGLCHGIITRLKQGYGTKFVPKAKSFFEAEDWQNPENFASRWDREQEATKPLSRDQKATLAAHSDRSGTSTLFDAEKPPPPP